MVWWHANRRCAICLVVLLSVYCLYMNGSMLTSYRGGVWRAYLMPTEDVWDSIHKHGTSAMGGIWGYNQSKLESSKMMMYLFEKPYESIWDVSCNVGFMLSSLLKRHPNAQHYGTDISNVMVETTRQNCPSCVAAQFDLGSLRYSGISPKDVVHEAWHREDMPKSFDVILVSDVLLFVRWGGIPPVLLRCTCCCEMFRRWAVPSQRTFMENLASLARDEVVFSYNQGNIIVRTMMRELGVKWDANHEVWRVPGTAGTAGTGNVTL
ncbi:unnamed protein product [Effrenium voratum]|nr:unnamed protein product [Effrenium voratum]